MVDVCAVREVITEGFLCLAPDSRSLSFNRENCNGLLLPMEILVSILELVDFADYMNLILVSKEFQRATLATTFGIYYASLPSSRRSGRCYFVLEAPMSVILNIGFSVSSRYNGIVRNINVQTD